MIRMKLAGMGLVMALGVAAGAALLTATPAEAVVYCKAVGVPKGCVARPPTAAVVYCTAPGVPVGCRTRPARVVYCTAPGVPVGCVARPAGTPLNRGGPVNRLGIR